ncbi:dephospho-CoA kinase isoform X2 [Arachis duranensis]|uniref:Dephospho-CoA kinase isoform X2 n=1 Tax=Arachis duranensis TaxID=130453 RepID=A0A6P5MTN4_ARADU|nr:dephospho-CoA kinase isoform X2 [Arachis duranensis]
MGFLLLTLTSSLVFVIYSKSFSCDDALKKWKKVVATFGEEILLENGEVNRPMLGQIVFSDPDKRQFLDRLLAPHISSGIFWEVVKLWLKGYKVIVLDVPLLFEAKIDKFTKPIIVVWIDPETQKKRLMGRDKSNEEDAGNRINAQMPLDVKRNKADIVIDNSGSLDDLKEQFQKFQKVLIEVSKPLTGTRFQEWSLGHASLISGLVLCIKALS